MTRVPDGLIEGVSSGSQPGAAGLRVAADTGTAANPKLVGADLGNVVVFRPRNAAVESAAEIDVGARPAPTTAAPWRPVWTIALFAGSAIVHGGLLLLFIQPPKPLASIGIESISVEIVLGAATPAGAAATPGDNETQSVDSQGPREAEAEPAVDREQAATAQPQEVPVAEQDATPEPVEAKVAHAEPAAAAAEPEPTPREPAPEPPAAAAAAESQPDAVPEPSPPVAVNVAPPPPEPKPDVRPKPEPEKAVKTPAKTRGERSTRIAARSSEEPATGRQSRTAVASTAASGAGVGRSDASSNYHGLVSAHLLRHKQYPPDARNAGRQGTATVAFSFDGGGRVTSVRLAGASGTPSIDQEVQAMVRRASPFPAPPDRHARTFTIPIVFRLN